MNIFLLYTTEISIENNGLDGNHFGVVVHFGNGMEKIDFFTLTKGVPHFEEGVTANIAIDTMFGVVEDQNSIGGLDFFEVFTDEVVFDFGIDFVFVVLHVGLVAFYVVEFVGGEDGKTTRFKLLLGGLHFPVKLHATADSDDHSADYTQVGMAGNYIRCYNLPQEFD
ncbi:MAG: hypothetical protein UX82_C0007G0005 [Microgenomates group bacterium GW2011_GWE1_47_12]|nr:MAG: hypothetical protein UX32_C0006G0012 [Microgenomates group bacterium GW2011_GWF1_46_12]KKU44949.1 MAG: hypothetical protein UX63_C0016G0015 [Microgenomates group bacterium GW2011_GWB1_46_7]KKU60808.1 MAG: hypothetical protein UX82_C0007G0005 [Microgenomates group bacterium GW2011_GWE1_47_12]KKU62781.1 MAG: hypothetical protein UX84_C0002G0042 [Microgenomates group bacterium GW2011_GWD1_47_13]